MCTTTKVLLTVNMGAVTVKQIAVINSNGETIALISKYAGWDVYYTACVEGNGILLNQTAQGGVAIFSTKKQALTAITAITTNL